MKRVLIYLFCVVVFTSCESRTPPLEGFEDYAKDIFFVISMALTLPTDFMKGRILCLDVGEKVIGCAVCDKNRILVTPINTSLIRSVRILWCAPG